MSHEAWAYEWRHLLSVLIDGLDHVLGQGVDVGKLTGRPGTALHIELVAQAAAGFVGDLAGTGLRGGEYARRRVRRTRRVRATRQRHATRKCHQQETADHD